MKKISVIIYLLLSFAACTNADTSITENAVNTESEDKTCNFFLIKEENNIVIIEKVKLTEGQVQVFKDENLISYIMVFPPGSKSVEVIQKNQRMTGIIAIYMNDNITVKILKEDGSQKAMPDINLKDAIKTDVRLNVTGANGYEQAFVVEGYKIVKEDAGPVMDLFDGKIPLNQGDYSFLAECLEPKDNNGIDGVSPFEILRDWIIVDCKFSNGETGKFVVDFGASNTVIPKNMLPKGSEIAKFEMVEHSVDGVKKSKAVTEGASGTVENIGGVSILKKFSFGNITLHDFKVTVLDDFPQPFIDAGIQGILGRDVLMKTNIVEIDNLNDENSNKSLIFSSKEKEYKNYSYKIPFNIAGGGNIFFEGKINDIPVDFFFDSGANISIVSKDYLTKNNIQYTTIGNGKKTSYGLDGKGTDYEKIEVKNIEIGSINLKDMIFRISDNYALKSMGMKENTGLLGMDFLNNYEKVVFDFTTSTMLLWKN